MAASRRHCSICRAERWFEQPPCEDGHDADCPELACITCGSAVLVGFDIETAAHESGESRATCAA